MTNQECKYEQGELIEVNVGNGFDWDERVFISQVGDAVVCVTNGGDLEYLRSHPNHCGLWSNHRKIVKRLKSFDELNNIDEAICNGFEVIKGMNGNWFYESNYPSDMLGINQVTTNINNWEYVR